MPTQSADSPLFRGTRRVPDHGIKFPNSLEVDYRACSALGMAFLYTSLVFKASSRAPSYGHCYPLKTQRSTRVQA
jgi:hypothetical protein